MQACIRTFIYIHIHTYIYRHTYIQTYILVLTLFNSDTLPQGSDFESKGDKSSSSVETWARFLSLARSKLRLCSANHRPGYWSNLPCDWRSTAWAYSEHRLCSANHRPGYWSNLPCDWRSTAWAYSEQEMENGPRIRRWASQARQQMECVLSQRLDYWASSQKLELHDDVIKWKHFPRYWPFVRGIHRSPVNSPHKGQRRGALMLSLICIWINGWINNREAGDLRRYRAHYDVIVMSR